MGRDRFRAVAGLAPGQWFVMDTEGTKGLRHRGHRTNILGWPGLDRPMAERIAERYCAGWRPSDRGFHLEVGNVVPVPEVVDALGHAAREWALVTAVDADKGLVACERMDGPLAGATFVCQIVEVEHG